MRDRQRSCPVGAAAAPLGRSRLEIRFDCTQCGRCCHDLRLPLSVDEALVWARRGHQVDVLIEASPITASIDGDDLRSGYRAARSFEGMSGSLPIRVHVTLVASHDGPCPHLLPNMRCGNYDLRPRVCRIYPAEIVPDIDLSPHSKACPPEAWDDAQPLFQVGRSIQSPETRSLIDAHREATLADVKIKAALCDRLGLQVASLANEGYATQAPNPHDLAPALEGLIDSTCSDVVDASNWVLVTNRSDTFRLIREAGANAEMRRDGVGYIGFFSEDRSTELSPNHGR